jgi:hypothetical protein
MKLNKKAQSIWISAVLYLLVTAVIMVLVLNTGIPVLGKLKDKSHYVHTRDTLLSVNHHIKELAKEGKGSQRVVSVDINKGKLVLENNKLKWEMETEANIVESGVAIDQGDITVSANIDVAASANSTNYILENSYVKMIFNKYGNATNYVNFTTGTIIDTIYQKKTSNTIQGSDFDFQTNSDGGNNGYTYLEKTGTDLESGTFVAYINSTFDYKLKITLNSDSNYFIPEIEVIS